MLSGDDPGNVAFLSLLSARAEREHVDRVTTHGFDCGLEGEEAGQQQLRHQTLEILCQLRIGIGMGWSEVNGIDFFKAIFEGECVIVFRTALPLDLVFEVGNFLTISHPAHSVLAVIAL